MFFKFFRNIVKEVGCYGFCYIIFKSLFLWWFLRYVIKFEWVRVIDFLFSYVEDNWLDVVGLLNIFSDYLR